MTGPAAAGAALAVVLVLAAGCDQPELRDQPKVEPYEAAPSLPGGVSALAPPAGTVPRDALLGARAPRAAPTPARLARGRGLFDDICAPCHGRLGDGEGPVVLRGFPHPPSFHSEHLRAAPDAHLYDVVSDGWGVMYGYAARVRPDDRWAVIDYVRALQLSQHAPVAALPPDMRAALRGAEAPR